MPDAIFSKRPGEEDFHGLFGRAVAPRQEELLFSQKKRTESKKTVQLFA